MGDSAPAWLVELALADSPRATELAQGDWRLELGALREQARLIASLRCPACGRNLVALLAARHPTEDLVRYLTTSPCCLHPG